MQRFTNVIIEIEKYVQHSLCNDRETNVCVLERGRRFGTNPGQPVKQSSLGWRDKWSEQIEGWSGGEAFNPVSSLPGTAHAHEWL